MTRELSLSRTCLFYDLGTIDYQEALDLQKRLVEARVSDRVPGVLLLLEHPSVFTIGRSGETDQIVAPHLVRDIPVFHTDRGGNITYHGPGQLVGYPILDLRQSGLGIHQYVRNIEEVVIRALKELGIIARRATGYPGVWVGEEKICSLGVRITRGVTLHGFALNVNTDLKYFTYIIPCGISGKEVTSIAKLTGREIAMQQVKQLVLQSFSQVFGVSLEEGNKSDICLTV